MRNYRISKLIANLLILVVKLETILTITDKNMRFTHSPSKRCYERLFLYRGKKRFSFRIKIVNMVINKKEKIEKIKKYIKT